MVAHLQLAAVPQRHGLEAGALDFDDGNVVILVAADDGGVVLLAVVERHLDVLAAVNDVVVGDDVAVAGEDEAGAGGGGLHRLAEVVRTYPRHVDGHHAARLGLIDLGLRERCPAAGEGRRRHC